MSNKENPIIATNFIYWYILEFPQIFPKIYFYILTPFYIEKFFDIK
jgi:hypothetical protein